MIQLGLLRKTVLILSFLLLSFGLSLAQSSSPAAQTQSVQAPEPPSVAVTVLEHLKFVSVDSVTHFRYMDSGPGKVTARDEYYKLSSRVQIDLAGDGTTYLQARGESGRNFIASYDFTGIGLHQAYWSYNLKSLYLGQRIGKHLEAQVGGIEFDAGVGSEMTYADNDGWLEGYRLRYTGLGPNLPEKISVTVGYVGDYSKPNVFSRLPRLGDENYIQLLAEKKLGATRSLSAEFDSLQGIRYTREALRWQKLPVPVTPDLTLETISRVTDNPSFGWAGTLNRNLDRKARVRAGVFYSHIPKGMFQDGTQQIFWNGDSYVLGKRIGPTVKIVPFKNFDVTLFGSSRLDNTPGTRYRGQIAVHYQLASLMSRIVR